MVDIFATAKPRGTFMKFEKIGDQVQGTYIDRYEGIDGYDNEQVIIVLKGEDSKIWNVGIKKYQKALLTQIDKATFGQIVGFRFEAELPSKSKPGKIAKIINCIHQADIVDQEWLDEQAKKAIEEDEGGGIPANAEPVTVAVPVAKQK